MRIIIGSALDVAKARKVPLMKSDDHRLLLVLICKSPQQSVAVQAEVPALPMVCALFVLELGRSLVRHINLFDQTSFCFHVKKIKKLDCGLAAGIHVQHPLDHSDDLFWSHALSKAIHCWVASISESCSETNHLSENGI
jgi:hypothetical protein